MADATNFNELTKLLKKDFSGLPVVRIAVLADSASQLFGMALKACGYNAGFHFDIWQADYDSILQTALDEESPLYSTEPEYVILWLSSKKLLAAFYNTKKEEKSSFANDQAEFLNTVISAISKKIKTNYIVINYPEINDNVFGNFANKTPESFVYQLRKLNVQLMETAAAQANFNVCDLSLIQNTYGSKNIVSEKLYVNTGNVLDIDFLPVLGNSIKDIILAYAGKFKKCLVLDLDNTLWGGVIGDDGLEGIEIGDLGIGKAFTDFQKWIVQLKKRGIILAICSKNTADIARAPFDSHPDMVLTFEDLAVFMVNWENKADNLRQIQSILNIGFDSMVFLDDNPAEREIIKRELPAVTVPDLPEDPSEYLSFLYRQNLFETASFTEADTQRNAQYREAAGRTVLRHSFTDEAGFLESLQMTGEIKEVDKFNLPRAAQLTQRSNQYNLRTKRYTEEQLQSVMTDENKITLAVSLKDKFGDYGLVSLLILEKEDKLIFIDTWIMSCRVLKRNMEEFVLNRLILLAEKLHCDTIRGEYLPTAKNGITRDHYAQLGFVPAGENIWELEVKNFSMLKTFIN